MGGMPTEAEAHHIDGGLRIEDPQLADRSGNITKDLVGRDGSLMT